MKVRVFTLCDGAYNYNGKLTIVGTTDNVKVPKFPAMVSIGLAFKVSFRPDESGKKIVRITIKNSEGADIVPLQSYPPTEPKTNKGEESRLCIGGNFNGIRFEEEGVYHVVVTVNDDVFELPFKVSK